MMRCTFDVYLSDVCRVHRA